jgi:hypothetical protein
MTTLIICLILIPLLGQIVTFWVRAVKWLITHQRSLGERLHRVRSAFCDAYGEK